jgi:hypothetical protein
VVDNAGPNQGARREAPPAGALTRAEVVGKVIDARREYTRQQYDWLKHQTTLSTGSILVVLGLVGSVLDFKRFEWLLVASVVCLVLSALLAFIAMFWTFHAGGAEELMFVNDAVSMHKAEQQDADQQDADALYHIVTRRQLGAVIFGGLGTLIFVGSIGSFIVFALLNLVGGSWTSIVGIMLFVLLNLVGGLWL